MASVAFFRVAWWRLAAARVRNRVLSALVIAGFLGVRDRFERGDDVVQAVLDLAEAGGEAGLAVRVGAGDQAQVDDGLAAGGGEGLPGGLGGGGGPAGIWGRAGLLWWAAAVSVWEGCPRS